MRSKRQKNLTKFG